MTEYLVRGAHLIAAVWWLGTGFFWVNVDKLLEPPQDRSSKNVEGQTNIIHAGAYYSMERTKFVPGELPTKLQLLIWEPIATWISGFLLLVLLYFTGGASLLIDPNVMPLTNWQAILIALGLGAGTWIAYHYVIYNDHNQLHPNVRHFLALCLTFAVILVSYRVYSGRGFFMVVGAVMGTVMAFNIIFVVNPTLRKIVKRAYEGELPSDKVRLATRRRPKHNQHMTYPVLLLMIVNHYPAVYNHKLNWLILILLIVGGAVARRAMMYKERREKAWIFLSAVCAIAIAWLMAGGRSAIASIEKVEFGQVRTVVEKHCLSCHSQSPTDDVFRIAPRGILLEQESEIRSHAKAIYQSVVIGKSMPLSNKSIMSDQERQIIGQWLIQQGIAK